MGTLESFLTVAEWKPLPLFCCNCTKQTNIQSNTKKLANGSDWNRIWCLCEQKKKVWTVLLILFSLSCYLAATPRLQREISSCRFFKLNSIFFFLLCFVAKINKFTAYLLLNPVGRCLRKVGGLATSAPGEFREGTQPPCSGAQTRLARQGCSTHVHAQMNARWEVGWGLGVGVVASIVPTGRPRSIQGPGFSHTHTLLLYSNALFHLHLIKRSAILFFFLSLTHRLPPPGFIFCISSLTARWNSCNKACRYSSRRDMLGHCRPRLYLVLFRRSSLFPQQTSECGCYIHRTYSTQHIETSSSQYKCAQVMEL